MRTWHRNAVEGIEVVVAEIERVERELVPLLLALVEALGRSGRSCAADCAASAEPAGLAELADGVHRLRRALGAAERAVAPVQDALRARGLCIDG